MNCLRWLSLVGSRSLQLPSPRTKYCPAASALSIAASNDEKPRTVVVWLHHPPLVVVVVFSLSVQTPVPLL